MQALLLTEPRHFTPVELPEATPPSPGHCLVAVRRVGICGTDLHAYQGQQPYFTYPRILGHELAVEVLTADPASGLEPGATCSVVPYYECGDCETCLIGRPNCCQRLSVIGVHQDGGMRERLVVPAHKLMPSRLPLNVIATVEPLSIGMHAWHRAQARPEERVLIIGAGPIGLAVLAAARAYGYTPELLERSERRATFVREQLGYPHVHQSADALPRPTLLFDCTGNPQSMNATVTMAAHGGTIVFVGIHTGDMNFRNLDFHGRELTLKASRNATAAEFREVLELIESGRIDPRPWITHEVPLADLPGVFPRFLDPAQGAVKPVVVV